MRRLVLAAWLVLFAGAAAAQTGTSTWQFNIAGSTVTASKSPFKEVAGVMEWNPAKPEASTLAFSLDTTTLSAEDLKMDLDAAHYPELRIVTTGPGRKNGDMISLPAAITIGQITKPVMLQVSYKANPPRQIGFHGEATIRHNDFKLKGSDIVLVIDGPFERIVPN
jgi:polyisoprenoid-binding protein YceI